MVEPVLHLVWASMVFSKASVAGSTVFCLKGEIMTRQPVQSVFVYHSCNWLSLIQTGGWGSNSYKEKSHLMSTNE